MGDRARGVEIQKTRPVLVITNDVANEFSRLVSVVPITSQRPERILVGEVPLGQPEGFDRPSKVLVQQIRAIDKSRLIRKLARISSPQLDDVDRVLRAHLGLE